MKERTRKYLRLVLMGVCLFSTAMFLLSQRDKQQGQAAYEDARVQALRSETAAEQTLPEATQETLPETMPETAQEAQALPELWYPESIREDENLEALEQLDIAALQQTNPEVIGWIQIPGTPVDYPLLQAEDNEYYLTHTWQNYPNTVGSIFLECQNRPGFSDFNTIVYGHNMRDGSMFAWVSNLISQWHFDNHPYVYIVLPEGILRYEFFSAYKADVEGKTYGLSFRQRQTRQDFIDYALEQSMVESDIVPEVTDRIITLSTCTGRGYSTRWVAHGRLKMVKVGSN